MARNDQWKYLHMTDYEKVWSWLTSKKNIYLGRTSLRLLRDQPIYAGETAAFSQYAFFDIVCNTQTWKYIIWYMKIKAALTISLFK